MERRQFVTAATAAFFAALLPDHLRAGGSALPKDWMRWTESMGFRQATVPLPEITAAVDVLVPADPEIPGDFKGSDYGGDWLVAATLGEMGQMFTAGLLNQYAQQSFTRDFAACTPDEQLEAIKSWVREREQLDDILQDLLSGLLTLSVLGTYEGKSPEDQTTLFTAMGWFDPDDPSGTFRIPNEGYPDSFQFPVKLKRGMRP